MNKTIKIRDIIKSSTIASIVEWSKPIHPAIIAICSFSICNTLCSLGITLTTKGLIDSATSSRTQALWRYGIILVILVAAQRLFYILKGFVRTKASIKLQQHMQSVFTESFISKEYSYLKSYHSGELVNRVFSDVDIIKNGILKMLPSLLQTIVSFIGAAVILISWDWRFVPVMVVAALIGLTIVLLFREPMKRRHKRMQEAEDALHASTQETFENIRIIKSSVSEKRVINQMNERREQLSFEQLRNGMLSLCMNNGLSSMFDISWLVCNLWGCIKIVQGTFTYGSLAAMIQLVGRIQSPIANAVTLATQAYGVIASAERLEEILGMPDEENGDTMSTFDSINFESVNFQYDDGADDVLLDITAQIKKREFIALTGISGGGKTSLFQLMLGIYKPSSGSISFKNGNKEVQANRATRNLFAYVPQGNTLMSGTLRDNLLMFTDHATEEALHSVIHTACLDDLISETGLDAKIGERGIGLSEGQAQRVAIARALLSDAPILLLDEATSALDEATEAKLLENISAMRDKTVIIVTHRRAALAICDYQLHIEDGRMTRI